MIRNPETGQWEREPIYDEEAEELSESAEKMEAILQERAMKQQQRQDEGFRQVIWEQTLEKKGQKPETYNQLTPDQQADLIADFHENIAQTYRSVPKGAGSAPQRSPQGRSQGPQGQSQERVGPKPSEVYAQKREKAKKQFLSEEDELDIIDTLFSTPG